MKTCLVGLATVLALSAFGQDLPPDKFIGDPIINTMYTADPSAHVFEGKLYVYPSHDRDSGVPSDDAGSHFDMVDYHVLSMDEVGGKVTDHGVALDINTVPWAARQMWAPDAAEKDGKYFFYFPAKDKQDVFRIGVATGDSPAGPFVALPEPIAGSYSIDPAVFQDDDGSYYMYLGGIWGGQLQRWESGEYVAEDTYPAQDAPAIQPRVAKMSDDMLSFAEPLQRLAIVDEKGEPLTAGDDARRFFEAAWMHKRNGTYYFSYSTGGTHFIQYATADNPYGPFTYRGKVLEPVLGWTNHHSIVEHNGRTYLFYHDSSMSNGTTHLRSVKVTELQYDPDGSIVTVDAYLEN